LETLDFGLRIAFELHLVTGVLAFKNPDSLIRLASRQIALGGSGFQAGEPLGSHCIRDHLCRVVRGATAGCPQSRNKNKACKLAYSHDHDIAPSVSQTGDDQ
jgi:hypothetical protein